jgi:hypothetical protein
MKKIILAATVIIIIFTACKKNKVEEPAPAPAAPTHLGLWKGKFSNSMTTQPTFPVFALLTQDGNAKIYNGSDTATAIQSVYGVWVISGLQVLLQYQMPGAATKNFIRFFSDDIFTKSVGGNSDYWGNGTLIPNNGTAIGLVSFTKP